MERERETEEDRKNVRQRLSEAANLFLSLCSVLLGESIRANRTTLGRRASSGGNTNITAVLIDEFSEYRFANSQTTIVYH
jgi:hypothetical protein